MARPRRFDNFDYRGFHGYFVTACTFDRVKWFSREEVANDATTHLLRTASDYGFEVMAYCFMPDHLHAIAVGISADADFKRFMAMFKQRSAFAHRKDGRLWQEGYFEHVIRSEELIQPIAAYILANPLRAGLCENFGDYPFLGSSRYTIEQLAEVAAALKGPPHTG
jgi:putative transposase